MTNHTKSSNNAQYFVLKTAGTEGSRYAHLIIRSGQVVGSYVDGTPGVAIPRDTIKIDMDEVAQLRNQQDELKSMFARLNYAK